MSHLRQLPKPRKSQSINQTQLTQKLQQGQDNITQPSLSCQQIRWLDLFSQFDITIPYVPGKSSVFTNALSCYPDLAAFSGQLSLVY